MLNGISASLHTTVIKNNAKVASVVGIPRGLMNNAHSDFDVLNYPTDFWGEYPIKAKP